MRLPFCFALLTASQALFAASYTVTTLADNALVPPPGSLRAAMENVFSSPQAGDTITFDSSLSGTLTLASYLPPIKTSVAIVGPTTGSVSIDGGGIYNGFFVAGGTVEISNLSVINALALGGNGGNGLAGGGGALGGGGGLFVNNGAVVSLINVDFTSNNAQGGGGGSPEFGAGGCGGGGGGYASTGGNSAVTGGAVPESGGGGGGGIFGSNGGSTELDLLGLAGLSGGGGGGVNSSPGGACSTDIPGNSGGGGGGGGAFNSAGGTSPLVGSTSGPYGGGGGGGLDAPGAPATSAIGGSGGGPNGGSGGNAGQSGVAAGVNGGGGGGGTSSTTAGAGGAGGSNSGGGGGGGQGTTGGLGGSAVVGGGGGGGSANPGNGGSATFIGGGGGAGWGSAGSGGAGGVYSGGGGATTNSAGGVVGQGGNGGLGGGGGGGNPGGIGGFGAGDGGTPGIAGEPGDSFGGAIFLATGGTLVFQDGGFSGNSVTGGILHDGRDLFLMDGTTTTANITGSNQVTAFVAGPNHTTDGTLIKTGSGTLNLTMDTPTSFNGDISVNGGTLNSLVVLDSVTTVNAGGTFTGHGTAVDLHNPSGNVIPGPPGTFGTMVAGTYTQGPTADFTVNLNATGQNNRLAVAGAAALDGTIVVNPVPGPYLAGTEWTVLTGSPVTGVFSSIVEPAGYNFLREYTPTSARLVLANNVLFPPSCVLTGNAAILEAYINAQTILASSDIFQVLLALSMTDCGVLQSELNQLLPSWLSDPEWALANTLVTVSSTLRRRICEHYCCCCCRCCCCPRFEAWVEGFGDWTNLRTLGQLPAFRSDDAGVVAGIHGLLGNRGLIGIAGGYSNTELRWRHLLGKSETDNAFVIPYAVLSACGLTLDGSVVASWQRYRTQRHIKFSTIDRIARSHHLGNAVLIHGGGLYEWCFGSFAVGPYADIDYLYIHQDWIVENGANSLNLTVRAHDREFLRYGGGLSIAGTFNVCCGCLTPRIRIGYVGLSPLSGNRMTARLEPFVNFFVITTTSRTLNQIIPAVEINYSRGAFTANVQYFGQYCGGQTVNAVTGGIRYQF